MTAGKTILELNPKRNLKRKEIVLVIVTSILLILRSPNDHLVSFQNLINLIQIKSNEILSKTTLFNYFINLSFISLVGKELSVILINIISS
jgi:hypothetical protein